MSFLSPFSKVSEAPLNPHNGPDFQLRSEKIQNDPTRVSIGGDIDILAHLPLILIITHGLENISGWNCLY